MLLITNKIECTVKLHDYNHPWDTGSCLEVVVIYINININAIWTGFRLGFVERWSLFQDG